MRRLMTAGAFAALLASAGCKPPPKEQAIEMFKRDVQRYFNDQNRESLDRKERLRGDLERAKRNPLMDPATGTLYTLYSFDPAGFVVDGYKCQTCGILLTLAAPDAEPLCRSCGHSPHRSHTGVNRSISPCSVCCGPDGKLKATGDDLVGRDALKLREGAVVRDMFELTQDNPEKPLTAKIRYVRRLWVFDPRGTVKLSQAAQNKAAVDMTWVPSESGVYDPSTPNSRYGVPGFHRLDGVYVGEITFEWKGGSLRELSRQQEQPVRPWKDLKTVGN